MSTNQPRKPAGTPVGGQFAPTTHAEADVDLDIASLDVLRATNLFGPLDDEARRRLMNVISKPSRRTWDKAYRLILNRRTSTTLWQAVVLVDPSFPTFKHGDHWEKVPDRKTLLEALHTAVYPKIVTCDMDPQKSFGPGSYHSGPHELTSSCENPVEIEQKEL